MPSKTKGQPRRCVCAMEARSEMSDCCRSTCGAFTSRIVTAGAATIIRVAATGGSSRIEARGPHAVEIGSSSMDTRTAVHAAWRAAAVLIRAAHRTLAVAPPSRADLMAHSTSRRSITSSLGGSFRYVL